MFANKEKTWVKFSRQPIPRPHKGPQASHFKDEFLKINVA